MDESSFLLLFIHLLSLLLQQLFLFRCINGGGGGSVHSVHFHLLLLRLIDSVVEEVHDDVRERLHLVVRLAVVGDDLGRVSRIKMINGGVLNKQRHLKSEILFLLNHHQFKEFRHQLWRVSLGQSHLHSDSLQNQLFR